MAGIKITETALPGVVIVEPAVFRDERGTFSETFSEREFGAGLASLGLAWGGPGFSGMEAPRKTIPTEAARPHFVQDNESHSAAGVVRGLHFQKPPHAQAKLVRVVRGRILDVALDMRRSSPTLGKWLAVKLSADNHLQLFIPKGFAHGFVALEDDTVLAYKCDDYYAPECDGGVLWCDPALGIDWGVEPSVAIVSPKDAALPLFADAYKF